MQPSEPRDFPEWHRGRAQYALWAVLPDSPELARRVTLARECLHGLLLPGYHRAPHVTVEVCGFTSSRPCQADDFDRALLDGQLAALARARVAPFELRIGGADTFATAPYLTVRDDGSLARLRAAIGDRGLSGEGFAYVPHVTLGLYEAAVSHAELSARFAGLSGDPLRLPVRHLHLLGYVAAVTGGPLTVLARWDLAENLLTPTTDFPFRDE